MDDSTHQTLWNSVEDLVRAHVRDFIQTVVEDEVKGPGAPAERRERLHAPLGPRRIWNRNHEEGRRLPDTRHPSSGGIEARSIGKEP